MLLARLLNHLLAQAPEQLQALQPLAGRSFALQLPLLTATVVVMPDGRLADSQAEPEATLTLPTAYFLTRLTDPQAASRQVVLAGDPDLAARAGAVLGALAWDAAEDLSRWTGDIVAHRVVRSGQALAQWPLAAGERLATAVAEYARDEARWLVRKEQVADYCSAVDTLRHDVARLEKRLARLQARLADKGE
ncbi:ubiquinone biosynthesis accessory factor UbiJ [Chitinibacter tainanensis]|uniref:ubiquinone biosynthesis accessory factor UbiJ n=1 Tax=Chitinibacter tainanensis TaxID=230667 RepID=UPI000416882B|nr:hypothetical protein [Chitinibacter tainanensis]